MLPKNLTTILAASSQRPLHRYNEYPRKCSQRHSRSSIPTMPVHKAQAPCTIHLVVVRLNDNSHPEEIKSVMKMSKKTFKKAIGSLYKQKLIDINNEGIQLV